MPKNPTKPADCCNEQEISFFFSFSFDYGTNDRGSDPLELFFFLIMLGTIAVSHTHTQTYFYWLDYIMFRTRSIRFANYLDKIVVYFLLFVQ